MKSITFVKKIEAVNDIKITNEHKEIVLHRLLAMEEHPERCLSLEVIESNIKL